MAKILIVEDSADMRQLMHDLLDALGHDVIEAEDGLEGVKNALSNLPDLIIMDLMMPNAAGDTTLRFMRGTPELKSIPVLVVSAHADVAHIAKSMGADSWMAKPISIDELSKRISEILSGQSSSPVH
ncbi:MAG: response regulator [Anaerolinea sp.]|nr:response regulator [Anaerolinea sp.]MCC6975448.1 response regulator [Anaerolineae bacterium]CAG0990900.1 Response regulator ArlR [Anaerolineae bacterium]